MCLHSNTMRLWVRACMHVCRQLSKTSCVCDLLVCRVGRRHVAEGHLNPPPKALSLERSVWNLFEKLKSKILRPPKPPTGPNMPAPKHLFTPFWSLFTPFYTTWMTWDPNLAPSWLPCLHLDAILCLDAASLPSYDANLSHIHSILAR